MMKLIKILSLWLLMGISPNIFAQTIAARNVTYIVEIETLFSLGVAEYRNQNYQKAMDIFVRLENEYPPHQRITATYLMLGKAYYQSGKYSKGIASLKKIINNYPNSNYVDDAHSTMGYCYYQDDKYIDAAKEFLWLADYAKHKVLMEQGRNTALKILDNNLKIKEVENIKMETTGKSASAILTLMSARKWERIGDAEKAIKIVDDFMKENPHHKYNDIMSRFLEKARDNQKYVDVKIGVILPLSSDYAEQAQSILTGIKYAHQKFDRQSKYRIRLVMKDSEGSVMNCIKAAQDLVKDEKVVAVIGELESEKTACIAPIVDYYKIPLIAPVASENGLAALSDYLFQINGDLDQRGVLMAKYATLNDSLFKLSLHISLDSLVNIIKYDSELDADSIFRNRTFATLSPADNYGKEMTDSFTATVDKLGGEIVAQKWYYNNTQDVVRQFKSIRDVGFTRTNKDSLFREYTRDMNDFQRAKFDEDKIPVETIDALFFPIYADDIEYVVPQYAFANIRANIFGGQYWYNLDELRKKNVVSHVENLVFESDYYFDEFDPKFSNFRNDFLKVMGTSPNEMECYGYDAMTVILHAIERENITREMIKDHLNGLTNYIGIRGPINFKNSNRVNTGQRIITFQNQRFKLLN